MPSFTICSAAAAFLCRLEDHRDIAGEVPRFGEVLRRAEQHGRMAVMAAGMHLAGGRRGPGPAACFGDRQGVHVGPEPDGAARAAIAADEADDPGPAEAGHDFVNAEFPQFSFDEGCRIFDREQELRVLVQMAPPFGHFVLELGGTV